jgi:chromate reductase, NAD(P)H dehydrogenase (quinone)
MTKSIAASLPTKILAISGSLRARSINTALLRAAAAAAPPGIEVSLCQSVGCLPLFNPDLEASDPAPVRRLREQIIGANALLIACPEYAHGVPGAMKNALDWMVGNEAFVHKPVGLINAAARATHAQAALREIVTAMSARVVEGACLVLERRFVATQGIVDLAGVESDLARALQALRDACGQAASGRLGRGARAG